MRVAVASGKGGTGKTTVTASLAAIWGSPLTVLDLDVEEPNLHLFLHPELDQAQDVTMEVPEVDEELCTACRACSELCQFKAIAVMGDTPLVFPELCHGCGGCLAVCPTGALTPGSRVLGQVGSGYSGDIRFFMGTLRIGEAMSPPLMRAAKKLVAQDAVSQDIDTGGRDLLMDAPPGVSCPAIAAAMDTDCLVLVTEPTPFGLHDLDLARRAFAPLGAPMGVVLNRAFPEGEPGNELAREYCAGHGLPIWAEIPFDRKAARAYSEGLVLSRALPELVPVFQGLLERIREAAQRKEAAHA